MPKARITPERVAGVVALSYLALFPLAAFFGWRKLVAVDEDLTIMWDQMGMDTPQAPRPTMALIKGLKGSRMGQRIAQNSGTAGE